MPDQPFVHLWPDVGPEIMPRGIGEKLCTVHQVRELRPDDRGRQFIVGKRQESFHGVKAGAQKAVELLPTEGPWATLPGGVRSEERRVGKGWRSWQWGW